MLFHYIFRTRLVGFLELTHTKQPTNAEVRNAEISGTPPLKNNGKNHGVFLNTLEGINSTFVLALLDLGPVDMPNLWFRLMAAEFKIRDTLKPRKNIIEEVGINEGFKVLDFGCGPGGYVLPTSKLIGKTGKLFALDVMPVAIDMVKNIIKKNNLKNAETILSNCNTGLPDDILDVALLYDAFHDLENQNAVLQELHRVLKPSGTLSFSDHHMKETSIISAITNQGLFKLLKKGKYAYSFIKI